MTRIGVIDYGAGNLRSVAKALAHVAPEAEVVLVSDAASIASATHLILPGVGAFGDCMRGLTALPGVVGAMEQAVFTRKVPFLGICVGMQLLFERGLEHGEHTGLGWFRGDVVRLCHSREGGNPEAETLASPDSLDPRLRGDDKWEGAEEISNALKVPHMGWNSLDLRQPSHPIFTNLPPDPYVYFVHSYHAVGVGAEDVLATTAYGATIIAMVGRDNIVATQFHPEKSQEAGLCLLRNFGQMR